MLRASFIDIVKRGEDTAITAQIGLSVIVWNAAVSKKIKVRLYILAIFLYAVLDGVAVLAAKNGMSLILVEVLVWLTAAGIALIARNVWRKGQSKE